LSHPDQAVPDLLNKTFQVVDSRLSALAASGKTQSGCTAVTAFLRVEQDLENEPKGFTNPNITARGLMHGKGEDELEAQTSLSVRAREDSIGASSSGDGTDSGLKRKMSGRRIRNFVKGLTSSGSNEEAVEDDGIAVSASDGSRVDAIDPKSQSDKPLKRVLYTANVGDARAVLSYVTPSTCVRSKLICRRGGKAVRLTYDHKGSDTQEAKRIMDAGGFVMNNRVNGV
jgi:protein phosphatase PTC1